MIIKLWKMLFLYFFIMLCVRLLLFHLSHPSTRFAKYRFSFFHAQHFSLSFRSNNDPINSGLMLRRYFPLGFDVYLNFSCVGNLFEFIVEVESIWNALNVFIIFLFSSFKSQTPFFRGNLFAATCTSAVFPCPPSSGFGVEQNRQHQNKHQSCVTLPEHVCMNLFIIIFVLRTCRVHTQQTRQLA